MSLPTNFNDILRFFEKDYDTAKEDNALSARGQFLQLYPLNHLKKMTLDDYVIGKGTASFCACVEVKTRTWANMQGATALKFGIYYGKSKSDPTVRYRFTQKFGDDDITNKEVFANVKDALLDLIQSGKELDFRAIDENPLSQMFKAKILSLYFPEHFINICSKDHLKEIAMEMGIKEQQFISKYQHLLFKKKLEHKITRNWSNPKYMSFLYAQFIRKDLSSAPAVIVKKPQKRNHPEVNLEEITDNRDLIGKKSEEYALNWEKNRLIGLGYSKLAEEIDDRRNRPTYGYDFLSFNAPGDERYIEVKSIGRDGKEGAFRFFLSGNELTVSNLSNHSKNYYFYLVQYGKDGEPCNLYVKHAQDLYTNSEMSPCAYVVRFDLEEPA